MERIEFRAGTPKIEASEDTYILTGRADQIATLLGGCILALDKADHAAAMALLLGAMTAMALEVGDDDGVDLFKKPGRSS